MTKQSKFLLIYAPEIKLHLKAIERKYYSLICTTIEKELLFEPDVETKNRKPLKRQIAFEGEWELRFGPNNRFRVFYDIDMELHKVYILAIGVKKRSRLFIGGKEIKL